MKKARFLSLILAILMLCLTFAGCKKDGENAQSDFDYIKGKGELVIGITLYEPMNYYDTDGTTLIGFDTEFAKAVCTKLGITPKFQVIEWGTKETELKAKNIDCIWNGLTVTEERRANMDFSKSYMTNKQCVVIKSADAETYKTTADFKEKTVAAEKGSAGETAITTDAGLSEAFLTQSKSQANALLELKAGNVDAIVIDYTMAKASVGTGDYADFVIIEGIALPNEEYAIGFRTDSDLTAKVNTAIDELVADGTLLGIAEKYDCVDRYNEAIAK